MDMKAIVAGAALLALLGAVPAATPTTSMSHIAITNVANGKSVEWMEKVGDEQCGR
jgi:hypothetical protein